MTNDKKSQAQSPPVNPKSQRSGDGNQGQGNNKLPPTPQEVSEYREQSRLHKYGKTPKPSKLGDLIPLPYHPKPPAPNRVTSEHKHIDNPPPLVFISPYKKHQKPPHPVHPPHPPHPPHPGDEYGEDHDHKIFDNENFDPEA